MMHVEIDDGDALGAMRRLGVTGGDGDVVDKAEAHRIAHARVMAGRARCDKGRVGFAAHHFVHSGDGAARRTPDGFERRGAHDRIAVERGIGLARLRFFERGEITFRMDALERLYRRARRVDARKKLERFRLEFALNCAQPVRALRMTRAHFMEEAAFMREEKGFHKPDA
jgi:hypothetical protein